MISKSASIFFFASIFHSSTHQRRSMSEIAAPPSIEASCRGGRFPATSITFWRGVDEASKGRERRRKTKSTSSSPNGSVKGRTWTPRRCGCWVLLAQAYGATTPFITQAVTRQGLVRGHIRCALRPAPIGTAIRPQPETIVGFADAQRRGHDEPPRPARGTMSLVERLPDREDRRSIKVQLTRSGRKIDR